MLRPNFISYLFPYIKRVPVVRYMFEAEPLPTQDPEALPRVIYMFWDRDIRTAPELVQFCVASWQRLNPGWSVTVLDSQSASAIVDPANFPDSMSIQAYSDLLRITILAERGGVWADATALCLRPLDDWLPPIFGQANFFAFHRPGRDRFISSWFMAAASGAPLASRLRDFSLHLWGRSWLKRKPYLWFHYLFEYMVRVSPYMRRQWEAVPKISAVSQQLLLQWYTQNRSEPAPLARMRQSYVQKLSFKDDLKLEDIRAVLAALDTPATAKLLA